MSVATQKERIAAICELITGVTTAFASAPRGITNADLVAVVVLTGEAQREQEDNMLNVYRLYRLALLVKPWVQGIELEAEEACEPFFERFEDAFFTRPSLQLADNTTPLAGVQNSLFEGDTGVTNIELGGKGYAGVIFNLNVHSIRVITRGQ